MSLKIKFIFTGLSSSLIKVSSGLTWPFPRSIFSTMAPAPGMSLYGGNPIFDSLVMDISDKGWSEGRTIYKTNLLDDKSEIINHESDITNQRIPLNLDTTIPATKTWIVLIGIFTLNLFSNKFFIKP